MCKPEAVYGTIPHRKSSIAECPNAKKHYTSVVIVMNGMFNSESWL